MTGPRSVFACLAAVFTAATAHAQTPPSGEVLGGIPVSIEVTSHVDGQGVAGTEADVRAVANLGDALSLDALDSTTIFVLDISLSSIEPSGGFGCGDQNNDGMSDTNIDCELVAADILLEEAAEQGVIDRVGLVVFEGGPIHPGDLSPGGGLQLFVEPGADDNANGTPDVLEAMRSVRTWPQSERLPTDAYHTARVLEFTDQRVGDYAGGSKINAGVLEACNLLADAAPTIAASSC